MFKKLLSFVNSVIEEGKKVVWPTRVIVLRHTGMVVAASLIAAAFFAGIDYLFNQLVVVALVR